MCAISFTLTKLLIYYSIKGMNNEKGAEVMLTAVIVDDEQMICTLIERLVDWEACGVQIIGMAHDGQTALDMARRDSPDIIITDIRIPVLDGLELISRVQQFAPHTRFIVISGYRHFEYAHSALRYGVTDYLLKPINADELRHALTKLTGDILHERSEQASRAEITEQLSKTDARLRRQFLAALTEGKPVPADAGTINQEYKYALRDAPVEFFIIKASCLNMDEYDLMPLVFSRTARIVQGVLQPSCMVFELLEVRSRLYCLFQRAEDAPQGFEKLFQQIADQLDDVLGSFEAFVLTLCPAAPAPTPAALPQAVADAEHMVHLRLNFIRSRIVDRQAAMYCHTLNIEAAFPRSNQAVFSTLVQSGEREKVQVGLQQIFDPFRRPLFGQYDPEILFVLCRQVLHLVRIVPGCEALDFAAVERAADHACSPHALMDHFCSALLTALEPYFVQSAEQTGAPIRKAIAYIESHYAEPLALDAVALQTGLSPAYFSTLFKKETGSSFVEYLTLCRMNTAKRLLRHSSEPIAAIAEQAGYLDAKYFSRVFTKTFGISPQKYRNL